MKSLPTLTFNDEYPTLNLKIQSNGFSYQSNDDFIVTKLRGAPSRITTDLTGGWYSGKLKIFLKSNEESQYFDSFYNDEFNGKLGGIERKMPFFINADIDGVFGKYLCQITSRITHSNFKANTKEVSFSVEIKQGVYI